jgi:multiple sugar transport system ATP-binding protein
MKRPKLELIGLSKEYEGGVVAVDGIDLSVNAGEAVALLGPSGCGKSTTLNMIVGLEQPTAGDIHIDGVSVKDTPAGRRNVGLVFQDYAVFTHMTVADNLAFGLRVRGASKADITRDVGAAAELLGLLPILKERARSLGGSELQRVAIGRTLVTKPSILLLDEPLSNLEAEARATMRRELRRLQSEIGQTLIYVTHDQIEALSLANRIAVMSAGKIRQFDTTATVYDAPAHTFVAGFIGMPGMNLLSGTVTGSGLRKAVMVDGAAIALSAPLAMQAPDAATAVTLGVRPERVRLGQDGGLFKAVVTDVAPRGAETVVTLAQGNSVLKAVVATDTRPAIGTTVSIAFDAADIQLFSAETGRNLAALAALEDAA